MSITAILRSIVYIGLILFTIFQGAEAARSPVPEGRRAGQALLALAAVIAIVWRRPPGGSKTPRPSPRGPDFSPGALDDPDPGSTFDRLVDRHRRDRGRRDGD